MKVAERIESLKKEVEALTSILEAEGYGTFGSKGQPVAHWALGARHAAIALLHKLENGKEDEGPSELDRFLASS